MQKNYEILEINLTAIQTDSQIQPRDGIDEQTVVDYAESLSSGAIFPPIDVYEDDGGNLLLASGEQRLQAYKRIGADQVRCRVFQGGWHDAWLHARGANKHGKSLTTAEKQRIAREMLLSEETSHWSDNAIARHIGVSQPFVSKIRSNLSNNVINNRERLVKSGEQTYVMQKAVRKGNSDHFDPLSAPILQETAQKMNRCMDEMLKGLIEMGYHLSQQKEELPVGTFGPWIEHEQIPVSADAAEELILLAAAAKEGQPESELLQIFEKIEWGNRTCDGKIEVFTEEPVENLYDAAS